MSSPLPIKVGCSPLYTISLRNVGAWNITPHVRDASNAVEEREDKKETDVPENETFNSLI